MRRILRTVWENGPVSAILLFDGYKPDKLHTTLADIPKEARASEIKLSGQRVFGDGVAAIAGDLIFRNVKESPARLNAVVFVNDAGPGDSDRFLLVMHDRLTLPNLVFKPNGGDITVSFEKNSVFQI